MLHARKLREIIVEIHGGRNIKTKSRHYCFRRFRRGYRDIRRYYVDCSLFCSVERLPCVKCRVHSPPEHPLVDRAIVRWFSVCSSPLHLACYGQRSTPGFVRTLRLCTGVHCILAAAASSTAFCDIPRSAPAASVAIPTDEITVVTSQLLIHIWWCCRRRRPHVLP